VWQRVCVCAKGSAGKMQEEGVKGVGWGVVGGGRAVLWNWPWGVGWVSQARHGLSLPYSRRRQNLWG